MYPSLKYYGEQHPRYGGKLHWPGVEGLPYRGDNVPVLSAADRERIVTAADAYYKIFDLSNPEDGEYYRWVRDRAANGLFGITHEEYHWDDNKKSMYVYLEWVQYYTMLQDTNGHFDGRDFTLRSDDPNGVG